MKDRVLKNIELSEVLAQMHAFLERQASRHSAGAIAEVVQVTGGVGLLRSRPSRVPHRLPQTQFYLSRRNPRDSELLEALPGDVFVQC
jgi:hypothetical protein